MIRNETSTFFTDRLSWHEATVKEGAARFERGEYYEIATHSNCELIGVWSFAKESGEIFEYDVRDEFLDELDDLIYRHRIEARQANSIKALNKATHTTLHYMRVKRKFLRNEAR